MYSEDERKFLFSHLTKDSRVLEYGSGESSVEIAGVVKELITVEHMPNWSTYLDDKGLENATLLYIPKNDGEYENLVKPEYGSYEEWSDYIEAPLEYAPFDVIFIDGSARSACASICKELGHKDTVVFIHDCNGSKFFAAYQYLEPTDIVFTMRKFEIK